MAFHYGSLEYKFYLAGTTGYLGIVFLFYVSLVLGPSGLVQVLRSKLKHCLVELVLSGIRRNFPRNITLIIYIRDYARFSSGKIK